MESKKNIVQVLPVTSLGRRRQWDPAPGQWRFAPVTSLALAGPKYMNNKAVNSLGHFRVILSESLPGPQKYSLKNSANREA